jgi:hypothetical protein
VLISGKVLFFPIPAIPCDVGDPGDPLALCLSSQPIHSHPPMTPSLKTQAKLHFNRPVTDRSTPLSSPVLGSVLADC